MGARLRIGAAAMVVGLAACTAAPTQTQTSVDPTGGVHTVQVPKPGASTTQPKKDFIRAVNFGEQEWTDGIDNRTAQLTGGTAQLGSDTIALGKGQITYADADGDGLEDALVPVVITYPSGPVTYLYIWLWDGRQQKAVQVKDPVAEYGSCGNYADSTAPGDPMGFQITEYIRDQYDNLACGVQPSHKFTRTVGVDKGGLVMTKPTLAYGGICYQTYRDPSKLPAAAPIRVAPQQGAAIALQAQNLYMTIPGQGDNRDWGPGWYQVSWLTDELKNQGYYWGICGFYWGK